MILLPDSFEWLGDAAILLRNCSKDERIKLLRYPKQEGIIDIICGPSDVVIQLADPFVAESVPEQFINEALTSPAYEGAQVYHRFNVRYGGEDTDLDMVSSLLGCDEEEVIRLHGEYEYEVVSTGFSPGFAYLGELPTSLQLPRKSIPALEVKKGAVAIAAGYTGIYPRKSAGGWWVIGYLHENDADNLWRWDRNPPGLLQMGDKVVFLRTEGGGWV